MFYYSLISQLYKFEVLLVMTPQYRNVLRIYYYGIKLTIVFDKGGGSDKSTLGKS